MTGAAGVADRQRMAVVRAQGEFRLVVTAPVDAGARLFGISGEPGSADRGTPGDPRFEDALDNYFWRFANHACEPTAVLRGREVHSLRPLGALEEITFHYATLEYELAEPFQCHCGAANCEGVIRGFRYLAPADRLRLRPLLSDTLLSIMDGRTPEPDPGWR